MITSVKSFFRNNIGSSNDYGSDVATKAVIGGATAVGAGIGAIIGSNRQAEDVVTIEKVPYAETIRVQMALEFKMVATSTITGTMLSKGSLDTTTATIPSCRKTVPNYINRPTGRTLYKDVKHHTVGFPNTMVQGALLGAGVGLATGIAGSIALRALAS